MVDEDEQRKEETQSHRAQCGQARQLFKLGKVENRAVVDVEQRDWRDETTTTMSKNETMTDDKFAARNPSSDWLHSTLSVQFYPESITTVF